MIKRTVPKKKRIVKKSQRFFVIKNHYNLKKKRKICHRKKDKENNEISSLNELRLDTISAPKIDMKRVKKKEVLGLMSCAFTMYTIQQKRKMRIRYYKR